MEKEEYIWAVLYGMLGICVIIWFLPYITGALT